MDGCHWSHVLPWPLTEPTGSYIMWLNFSDSVTVFMRCSQPKWGASVNLSRVTSTLDCISKSYLLPIMWQHQIFLSCQFEILQGVQEIWSWHKMGDTQINSVRPYMYIVTIYWLFLPNDSKILQDIPEIWSRHKMGMDGQFHYY